MLTQPVPASAGEETEEDQQFRTIFQQIAGNVSTREPESTGGTVSMVLGWEPTCKKPTGKKVETLVIITCMVFYAYILHA